MAKDMISVSEFYRLKSWTERSLDNTWRVFDNHMASDFKRFKRLENLEEYVTKGLTKKVRHLEKEVRKLGFWFGAASTLGVIGYKNHKKKIAELNERIDELDKDIATLNEMWIPKTDMTKYDTKDVNSVIIEGPFTRLLKNGENTSGNGSCKDEK